MTDDDVETLARECDWDNRKYMTPKDYAIWCERMRKFARLAALTQSGAAERAVKPAGWLYEQEIGNIFRSRWVTKWVEYKPGDARGIRNIRQVFALTSGDEPAQEGTR